MRLIWRLQARQDLRSILGYISERNPAAASDLLARINACTERLPQHPHMYRTGRKEGTREAVVHPNYVVVYRVGKSTVDIINVVHSRRQYPSDTE